MDLLDIKRDGWDAMKQWYNGQISYEEMRERLEHNRCELMFGQKRALSRTPQSRSYDTPTRAEKG